MTGPYDFIINLFRAFAVLGVISLVIAFLSLIVTFIFDYKNIREEGSRFSTGVGNALLVLHSFFEPGRKPQSEQIIRVKKRRTPIERKISGLSELEYDEVRIKGYKRLENKKYKRL